MNTPRSTSTEELYRNHYPVIAPLIMCNGIGDGRTTACVMAQAATIDALRKGQTLDKATDEMECCCPVLRRLAIRANDTSWWKDDIERTEVLRPLIPLLLDSRGDKVLQQRRAFFVADSCVRVLAPMRLEFIAEHSKSNWVKENNPKGATELRSLQPITSLETAKAAREVCQKWKSSAYADASASAYAYASASASADADADADADAQRLKYREAFLKMFVECAALK